MRRAWLVAPLAVLTLVLPAGAAVPDGTGGGYTCGLTGAAPSSIYFAPNPIASLHFRETGVLTGGPWFAPPEQPTALVSMRCTVVMTKEGEPPYVVADVTSMPTPGMATLAPSDVWLLGATSERTNIQVCTEITIYTDGQPPQVQRYDADGNPNNGAQCSDAQPVRNEGVIVYVAPPQADGDVCAYAQHHLYPPVPYGACVPWGPLGEAP
jgi:hypothetical protein